MRQPPLATVPARYITELVHHLEGQGLSCKSALKKAGFTKALLALPATRLSREALTVFLQDIARTSGRTDLGFETGLLTNLASVDVVGQLMLSAHSLAEGFEQVAPYFALVTPTFKMHCGRDGSDHVISFAPAMPIPYDMALMGLETIAVASHRLMLFLMQVQTLTYVLEPSWPAPAHAHRYRTLKGAKVRFGTGHGPALSMRLPQATAELPLPMASKLALQQANESCSRMLRELTDSKSWREWVRTMLHAVEGSQPTHHQLAAMMSISGRTLIRYLEAEGVGYRELALAVRHEKALAFLKQPSLTLADIAHRLGYSDVANFSRAFRAMAGQAPGAYRLL
ncbi:MAG: AraC family transcriptional regulator [Rubrivivax sp.]|nr:MAG: AraC family transcriptional regulator [Rubrivivax sp.]